MGLGGMMRPVVRAAKSTPGYPAARRRLIEGLRDSTTARRVSRASFPDLLDQDEAAALRDEALEAERAVHAEEMHQQRVKHSTRMKEQRREHKETLRKITKDQVRKADRRRRAIPAVSAGDLVAGLYLGDRPLIVIDVLGMDDATAAETLEEVAKEQVLGCAFRPMFLTDGDRTVWQRYGHLCEVVPPEPGWSGSTPYADYLAARLESLRADLGAQWWLQVPPTGLTDVQRAFLRRCGR